MKKIYAISLIRPSRKIMIKKYAFICMSLFTSLSQAQGIEIPKMPTIVSPSPTVATMMHFEEVPVDNYTGQPGISIPIYSKELSPEVKLNLSLNYTTLGVRIHERSGWTGTGWSLEGIGSISRSVRGYADEIKKNTNSTITGIYHNPSYWNFDNLSIFQRGEFLWNVNGTERDRYDSELDLYQFSILGATGRFVITKVGNTLVPKLLTTGQKINISLQYDADYIISSFTVTDPNGYKYVFTEKETSESIPVSLVRPQRGGVSPPNTQEKSTFVSAWHLTSIKTSNNVELATFEYYPNSIETYDTRPKNVTNDIIIPNDGGAVFIEHLLTSNYNTSIMKPLSVYTYYQMKITTKKISKITFKDQTSVHFLKSQSIPTHPENNGSVLGNIQIKDSSGNLFKNFSLNYEMASARLWLTQVSENGLKHKLSYYDKDLLSDFDSDPTKYDIWDYTPTQDLLTGDYNLFAVRRGLLKSIEYPTGGLKEFLFEPHTFSYEGPAMIEDFNSNPMNSTLQHTNASFQRYSNEGQTPPGQLMEIDYAQETEVSVAIQNQSAPLGGNPIEAFEVSFHNPTTGELIRSFSVADGIGKVFFPKGMYLFRLRPKLMSTTISADYYIHANVNIKHRKRKIGTEYKNYLLGGGVRIKEILFKKSSTPPGPGDAPFDRRIIYDYHYPNPSSGSGNLPVINGGEFSYGVIDAKLANMLKNYDLVDSMHFYPTGSPIEDCYHFGPKEISYRTTTNEPNSELTKGGYIGYKSVKVYEMNNGYSRYTYTTAQDYPTPESVFTYPYLPLPNLDFKRGLLLKQEVFNSDNKILKEISNNYEFEENNIATSITCHSLPSPWKQFYSYFINYSTKIPNTGECPMYVDFQQTPDSHPFYYNVEQLTSGWAKLTGSETKEYFYPNPTTTQLSTSSTFYEYNIFNYQVSKETNRYNQNGTTVEIKKTYEYPVGGYSSNLFTSEENTAVTQMTTLNIVNKPLITAVFKNNELLQRIINKYNYLAHNQQIILKEIESSKGSNNAEDMILFNFYDTSGNPLEIQQAKGTKISYIWGYGNTLPVAKIENMAYNSIPSGLITAIQNASNAVPYIEANLLVALENLRTNAALADALVSTYTYQPLNGITTETDAKGDRISYTYDSFGRLKAVKDKDGNMLSQNKYHYRTQN